MLMPGFDIVEKQRGDMVVSHRTIAEWTENKTRSIARLIDDNMEYFERFGQMRFKITTVTNSVGAVNKQNTYFLNEQQATFLMTLLRNSPVVVEFKARLVEEFFIMRNEIMHQLKYTKEGKNR